MTTIILLLLLLGAGWGVYQWALRAGSPTVFEPLLRQLAHLRPGGGSEELGPLIASLYRSLVDRSRRTWWTLRHHLDEQRWTIIASQQDAALLADSVGAIEADLNEALRANAKRHRIVISAPLEIVGVVVDDAVAPGRPRLASAALSRASSHQREPRPPVKAHAAPSAADAAGKAKPLSSRTNFGSRWEAPTNTTKTIGETFVASDIKARLWPLGSDAKAAPIGVPLDGVVLGRSSELGAGKVLGPTVSARHAELRRKDDDWVLRDLGSHNGTFLCDERITERPLQSGDVIGLGRRVRLRFLIGDDPLASTASMQDADGQPM